MGLGVVPPSSWARVNARKVKFSISVKCFIRISSGVSPVGLESGKSEICGAPVCWSINRKTLESFRGLDCRIIVLGDSSSVHDSLPLVCAAMFQSYPRSNQAFFFDLQLTCLL